MENHTENLIQPNIESRKIKEEIFETDHNYEQNHPGEIQENENNFGMERENTEQVFIKFENLAEELNTNNIKDQSPISIEDTRDNIEIKTEYIEQVFNKFENTVDELCTNREINEELIIKDESFDNYDLFECETCDLRLTTKIQLDNHISKCKNNKKLTGTVNQIKSDYKSDVSNMSTAPSTHIKEKRHERKRKHLTEEQKDVMICFMQEHGDISSSTFSSAQGRSKKRILLERLSEKLNNCPDGVIRTPKEWLRSWYDNKSKAKSKATAILRHKKENGGALPTNIHPLTPWEEKVVGLNSTELISGHNIIEKGVKVPENPCEEPLASQTFCNQIELEEESQPGGSQTLDSMDDQARMIDHDYGVRVHSGASTPVSSVSPSPENSKQRVKKTDEKGIEDLMSKLIKVQEDTNSSMRELTSAIRDGCREIAAAILAKK